MPHFLFEIILGTPLDSYRELMARTCHAHYLLQPGFPGMVAGPAPQEYFHSISNMSEFQEDSPLCRERGGV
jgi:hypothetical protein